MNELYKKDIRKIIEEEAISALTKKPVITYSSERVRLWSAIAQEVWTFPQSLKDLQRR